MTSSKWDHDDVINNYDTYLSESTWETRAPLAFTASTWLAAVAFSQSHTTPMGIAAPCEPLAHLNKGFHHCQFILAKCVGIQQLVESRTSDRLPTAWYRTSGTQGDILLQSRQQILFATSLHKWDTTFSKGVSIYLYSLDFISHTHTHTHARTHAHALTRTHTHARTHAHVRTNTIN